MPPRKSERPLSTLMQPRIQAYSIPSASLKAKVSSKDPGYIKHENQSIFEPLTDMVEGAHYYKKLKRQSYAKPSKKQRSIYDHNYSNRSYLSSLGRREAAALSSSPSTRNQKDFKYLRSQNEYSNGLMAWATNNLNNGVLLNWSWFRAGHPYSALVWREEPVPREA